VRACDRSNRQTDHRVILAIEHRIFMAAAGTVDASCGRQQS
jgi:hypothetical protein